MKSHVQLTLVASVIAVLFLGWSLAKTSTAVGVVTAVVGLLVLAGYGAWALRRGRHTPWTEATTHIEAGHAVVLWKPGCPYCERLLRALGDDDRITWVNVWHHAQAREQVCALNGGDEYVPTALVGSEVLRNPSAAELTTALVGGATRPESRGAAQ